MSLHQTSGNRRLGLLLATAVLLIWSFLPHALRVLLDYMDPFSITWYRFVFASLGFAGLLWRRKTLPCPGEYSRGVWALIGIATLGLAANYIGYLKGLASTSPATTQVMIQIGPVLLALGGIVIFRERFAARQWVGFVVLVAGLLLFFQSQIAQLADLATAAGRFRSGVIMIGFAAISWAIYSLAQKQLLVSISSQPLMLCIFVGCTLCFTPLADVGSLRNLVGVGAMAMAFSAFATAGAYGCFSAALDHIEASRVSGIIALVPLGTLLSAVALGAVAPSLFPPESHPIGSFLGAGSVVLGSLLMALGGDASNVISDSNEGVG
jgi:drug/metabolite transporter (DMT)-like permease